MLKIRNIDAKSNAFGGLNIFYPKLIKNDIDKLIEQHTGGRHNRAEYSASQIILGHVFSQLVGSQRLEDAHIYKNDLDNIDGLEIPSSDTTSRYLRSLASKSTVIPAKGENVKPHIFNINDSMLDLLIEIALKLKLVKKNAKNVLDYDNTIIGTKKWDATATYLKNGRDLLYGYQPGVASLNGIPIYLENRSGHSNAGLNIDETVIRCIEKLKSHGIKINYFRSDAAAHNVKLLKYLYDNNIKFVVRYRSGVRNQLDVLDTFTQNWKETKVGRQDCAVTSVHREFIPSKQIYRIAFLRKDEKDTFRYFGLITNIEDMTEEELIHFYNQRGQEEKRFADLKNNFNLKRLPFSLLEENTVFMIMSCIAYNIYQYAVLTIKKVVKTLNPNIWLKTFRKTYLHHRIIIRSETGEFQFENLKPKYLALFRRWWEIY